MGFFKDFKDDFSQAVNELMPGEDNLESTDKDDDMVVNTLEDEVDVASELSKLDGLLEQVTKQEPALERTQAATVEPQKTREEYTQHAMAAAQEEKKMADNTVTPVQVAQTGAQTAASQTTPQESAGKADGAQRLKGRSVQSQRRSPREDHKRLYQRGGSPRVRAQDRGDCAQGGA